MKNFCSPKDEYSYYNELKFFQLYATSFLPANSIDKQTHDKLFNSTKIRHLLDSTDSSAISLKTYDAGINSLNINLPHKTISANPIFQNPSEKNDTSLHTCIFFQRLAFCLNLNLYEKTLYNKQPKNEEVTESRKHLHSLLNLSIAEEFFCQYTFDIHNFYMPPLFVPLFVGIVGSLKKEKSSWKSFRENVLNISESFYLGNYQEIIAFIPNDDAARKDLWTYWIELYFPDDLYNLIEKFDNLIHNNDRILAYNLNYLVDKLANDIFFTRIDLKNFINHLDIKLDQYLSTPLVDPITLKHNNLDLCKEYWESSCKFHAREMACLRNAHLGII